MRIGQRPGGHDVAPAQSKTGPFRKPLAYLALTKPRVIELLATGRLDAAALISHQVASQEMPGAIELIERHPEQTRKVLGCHIFAPEAGEMIQLAAVAIGMGATKEQFDAAIAVHPTLAEELVTMRMPVRRAGGAAV